MNKRSELRMILAEFYTSQAPRTTDWMDGTVVIDFDTLMDQTIDKIDEVYKAAPPTVVPTETKGEA